MINNMIKYVFYLFTLGYLTNKISNLENELKNLSEKLKDIEIEIKQLSEKIKKSELDKEDFQIVNNE